MELERFEEDEVIEDVLLLIKEDLLLKGFCAPGEILFSILGESGTR